MPTCGSSSLFISRPSQNNSQCAPAAACATNLGPTDPLNVNKLSSRRNRDKVIEQIKDYVQLMLGAPVVDVELDEQQLDLAVKQTLKIMEYYAPREYFQYYFFNTTPGKSVYKLPEDVGYVRHIAYRETAEFAFQSTDLQGAIPIEYFYPGGAYSSIQGGLIDPIQPIWGRMGEWVMYKNYERMYSRVSSGLGGWEWIGGYKYIKLYPIPYRVHQVLVHYMQRQHDWDETVLWMQEGALIHAKLMLGMIRKKFISPPGPGGGIQLDGSEMYQEAAQQYKEWKQEILTAWGDVPPIIMG